MYIISSQSVRGLFASRADHFPFLVYLHLNIFWALGQFVITLEPLGIFFFGIVSDHAL